jgi:putative hydrolase of the HAD superfamily
MSDQHPRTEGVLFDLDQTLTDRLASIRAYADRFHSHFGDRLNGTGPPQIARTIDAFDALGYAPRQDVFDALMHLSGWLAAPDPVEVREHYLALFPRCAVACDGLQGVLDTLAGRGYRMGVVTNGSVLSQSAKIETLGVGRHFSTVVISEAVGMSKPDARIFHLAARNAGVEPRACLFVGDHPHGDVIGARDAGLNAVWREGVHPWPLDVPPPERRIRALAELLDFPELTGIRSRR